MVMDEYINFCRRYDTKVQKNKEDERKFVKKYLGIVLHINDIKYYVPLSSYKPEKHDNMKEAIDFIKIEDKDDKYAVLNLNNMIPVPDEAIISFNINILPNKTQDERKYRDLLRNEWNICKRKKDKIIKNALKIYDMMKKNKPENIVKRCCNFILLEEKIQEYLAIKEIESTKKEIAHMAEKNK
jgi:protein AbiQ